MATTPANSTIEDDTAAMGIPESDIDPCLELPTTGNTSGDRGFIEPISMNKDAYKECEQLRGSVDRSGNTELLFVEGNTTCIFSAKTWSLYQIRGGESLEHLLEDYSTPLKIAAISDSARGTRYVTKMSTRSTKKKPTVKGPMNCLVNYSEEDAQVDLGNQDVVVPLQDKYPVYLPRLSANRSKFSLIWDINWDSHLHLSHGRFPDGSSDQILLSHMLSTCLEVTPASTSKYDDVMVEAVIVISGRAEIPLNNCPPEPIAYEHRLTTYEMLPNFSSMIHYMVGPLAKCGFILIQENVIKCADTRCALQHLVSEVLAKVSREVVWHRDGCFFATTRRPCMDCVSPAARERECDNCGQLPRGERTFHHRIEPPEEDNTA